jgi:hypothetical protein
LSTFLGYTIREFNSNDKTVTVDFDDGSWTKIQLKDPFPTTRKELEDVIKQFAPSQEAMAARAAKPDLNFIHSLVGKSHWTFRKKEADPVILPGSTPSDPVGTTTHAFSNVTVDSTVV